MRRLPRFIPFLVASMIGGLPACGGDAPPPPAATPQAAPAPEPVKQEPAEVPLHDRGRVFLVGGEVGFVPLACTIHGATPPVASGDACLALLPIGASIRGMDGAAIKVAGTAKDPCGATAVTIEGSQAALRGHATAPPVDDEWVEVVPVSTPQEDDAAAPAELRAKVAAQVEADHAGLKAKKLEVRQRALLDLDADGAPEQVIAVAVPGPKDADGDETLAFAGLYVIGPDDAAPRKLAGGAPGTVQYRVLGVLDLDKNGKPELWLNAYDSERYTQSVEQVGEAGLTQLGRWVCEV